MITKEQLINGFTTYADSEVISKLPTAGKWLVGSYIVLATSKIDSFLETLKPLGVINDAGLIDEHLLLDTLYSSSFKYGPLVLTLPIVGTLKFTADDIKTLNSYLSGGIS